MTVSHGCLPVVRGGAPVSVMIVRLPSVSVAVSERVPVPSGLISGNRSAVTLAGLKVTFVGSCDRRTDPVFPGGCRVIAPHDQHVMRVVGLSWKALMLGCGRSGWTPCSPRSLSSIMFFTNVRGTTPRSIEARHQQVASAGGVQAHPKPGPLLSAQGDRTRS